MSNATGRIKVNKAKHDLTQQNRINKGLYTDHEAYTLQSVNVFGVLVNCGVLINTKVNWSMCVAKFVVCTEL